MLRLCYALACMPGMSERPNSTLGQHAKLPWVARHGETLCAIVFSVAVAAVAVQPLKADWDIPISCAFGAGILLLIKAKLTLRRVQSASTAPPLFLYIPIARLVLFSIASFGIYEIYWMYRNWRYVKDRKKLQIEPFWRAWFGVFYLHRLLRLMHVDMEAFSVDKSSFSWGTLATMWILLFTASAVLLGFSGLSTGDPGVLAATAPLLPTFLCFAPVQR